MLGKAAKAIGGAVVLAAAGWAAWQWWPLGEGVEGGARASQSSLSGSDAAGSAAPSSLSANASQIPNSGAPLSPAGQLQRRAQLALAQQRYERAEQTFAAYKDATRYPHESRPLAENPDQIRPFAPISEQTVGRDAQGKPVKFTLRTTQERVFLGGADSVKLTIEALDEKGALLPLSIVSARAQSMAESRNLAASIGVNLDFADDGAGVDLVPGDRKFTARLSPASQGFAQYRGTIRILATVQANGQEAIAHFDVVYTPGTPATWAGVREAFEAGSLNFYLKAQVQQAGRYVVSARVDDANGVPFALLQYNDEVTAGPREFKLHLIGVLVRDKSPTFPLRLRDVEGFLLLPNQYPDRLLMPRLAGVVYTSGSYSVASFSAEEWQSEERSRYLDEYNRDVEQARLEVQRLK